MSYDAQMLGLCLSRSSAAWDTAANLAAAAADWAIVKVHHPVQIKRISFFVTTLVSSSLTAAKVSLFSRPTSGSASGQVTLGVLTIPTGSAVGSVIYKDLESVRVNAGYDLAFGVTLQATDAGTAAGAGFAGMIVLADPDVPANQSKMVASA